MVVRQRKKKNRLRGHRSHGKGDTKNKRGAGCRGGRGKAGSKKHKRTKYFEVIGNKVRLKKQFVVRGKKALQALNLDDLNYLVEGLIAGQKAEKEGSLIVIDGQKHGLDKVLSRGSLAHKVLLKNVFASKKAIEKIEASGSKVEAKPGKKKAEELLPEPEAGEEAKPETEEKGEPA